MSSVMSFAYLAHFSKLTSSELMQIFPNGKRYLYSYVKFYVIYVIKGGGGGGGI